MKVASVLIQDLEGFSDFQLDLTYPEGHEKAGEAMSKVCFIGNNGSGRSRMIKLLTDYLREIIRFKSKHLFVAKLQIKERFIYSVHLRNEVLFFKDTIDEDPSWLVKLISSGAFTLEFNRQYEPYCIGFEEEPELFESLWFENNSNNVLIYQPSEPYKNRLLNLKKVPLTKARDVLSVQGSYPFFNEVSPEHVTEFWSLLIYTILQRDKAFKTYVKDSGNRSKPHSVMMTDFNYKYPPIVEGLAELWNPYLETAGLEVDVENADEPVNVADPLNLYIRQKASKERVDYGALGAGLRKLLFGLGYIWILHQHRTLDNGFCLIEEPENHLHPSMISGLIEQYQKLNQGNQLFVTTHNPLIATQFDPAERFIWSQEGIRRSELSADAGIEEILDGDFS